MGTATGTGTRRWVHTGIVTGTVCEKLMGPGTGTEFCTRVRLRLYGYGYFKSEFLSAEVQQNTY